MTTVAPARTALVTGASRGIGRAIAIGLAEAGLDVGLVARSREALAEVAGEIEALGRRAVVAVADVADRSAVDAAVAQVTDALGSIDVVVNNAGRIDAEVPLWESDPDEWWSVVETNVRGPYLLTRAVVPGMLARGGGRVIALNSGSGVREMDTASAYNVSKTALFRIGGSVHEAGFDRGLRTFELAPGVVRTDMTAGMDMHRDRTEYTPVERTVEMVVAMARGELDAFSGRYVRVTSDSPESLLAAAAAQGAPGSDGRRLRMRPWGEGDPLAD